MSNYGASLAHETQMAKSMVQQAIQALFYVLDQEDYTKAITMCHSMLPILPPLPDPTDNPTPTGINTPNPNSTTLEHTFLIMAKLAHAYAKLGQKYQAVVIILQMFGISTSNSNDESGSTNNNNNNNNKTTEGMVFPELQLYIKYARYERERMKKLDVIEPGSTAKKYSTGKKKASTSTSSSSQSSNSSVVSGCNSNIDASLSSTWDWIDQLTTVPTIVLPREGEASNPIWLLSQQKKQCQLIVFDKFIIMSLAMTLQHVLKFPYTAFQILLWSFHTISTTNPRASRIPENYDTIESYGHRAFTIGVGLLSVPQFQGIQSVLLTQLQVLALQMTRMHQQQLPLGAPEGSKHNFMIKYCTLVWAARVALWKNTLTTTTTTTRTLSQQEQVQRNISLRLAESMAVKCIEMYSDTYQKQLLKENSGDSNGMDRYVQLSPTESHLLYIQTLRLQKKYKEIVQNIDERLSTMGKNKKDGTSADQKNRGVLPRQTLLELKVNALQQLLEEEQLKETEATGNSTTTMIHDDPNSTGHQLSRTLEELLHLFPDDWMYWQQYCDAVCRTCRNHNVIHGTALIEVFRERILQNTHSNTNKDEKPSPTVPFSYRGPQLLHVELALRRLLLCLEHEGETQFQNNDNHRETHMIALVESMMQYGDVWSSRATCTYSDLSPYLDQYIQHSSMDQIQVLLTWTKSMIRTNCIVPIPIADSMSACDSDSKERQKQLRTYIFAVQVQFHIIRQYNTTLKNDLEELVTWEALVQVWQSFQASDNVDQAQMESRPADELVILAVQRLLYSPDQLPSPSQNSLDLMIAATILESAMQYSPYNPHLKICAIHVLGDVEASKMCWELYQGLSIKHIQHESCSYLILPILRSGGMFLEVVSVCREILGLHVSSAQEVPDFIGRAMEAGNMTKAEEFLLFHRDKMTNSLTNLEAKGLILDMAPLLVNEKNGILGMQQGIVGADTDFDRVKHMVSEAHNPTGAFSLLQIQGSFTDINNSLSDNRDFSVLSYEILWKRQFETTEIILSESLRRGHQHNLLIRAALCIEATKGPKKGKTIKPSLELQKRCMSLLNSIDKTDDLCNAIIPSLSNQPVLLVMRELCFLIATLSSGIDSKGEFALEALNEREDAVCSALSKAIESMQILKSNVTESKDTSTSHIHKMIADSIVPIFALLEMVAKIVDQFGWGKRKQKTKRCSAAVAEFALTFTGIITGMRLILERPSEFASLQGQTVIDQLPSVVDREIFQAMLSKVSLCKEKNCERIKAILGYITSRLSSFESEE